MLCEKYQNLSVEERIKLIGQLVHLVQNDDTFFELACKGIERGNERGILDGVTILPENETNY